MLDLIQRPFRGPKHSVPMIFVTTEQSMTDLVREALQHIYDGTPKAYPRGDMLFFIPLKGNDPYTPEQRSKFIFNHETYLGNEDVMAIHGLKDLNSEIILKGGKVTDIRTLLKSLPATTGMSRNRLFQVINPNAGLTCTIATFQQKDKPFVEQRKPTLEAEIRSCLALGESIKVFKDDVEGIWFGVTIKRRNGKPVSIQAHSKEDISFLQHANNLLNSPPKNKRPFSQSLDSSGNSLNSNSVNYSSILQARRTLTSKSVSVQDPEGNTTTTTTKTSQITATVETRFQTIELEIKNQR